MQQEPLKAVEAPVAVTHTMSYDSHGSKGPGVYCTCGANKIHNRGKVLVKWYQRHTAKTGHRWKKAS